MPAGAVLALMVVCTIHYTTYAIKDVHSKACILTSLYIFGVVVDHEVDLF